MLASLCYTSSSAYRLSGALPGKTFHGSDQLGAGVHHNRRLVPVEPTAAALAPVAHLRVTHRHHPVPAHPVPEAHSVTGALHVLEQQLPQQFRCRHYLLAPGAVLRQFPLRPSRQFQQPVRIGHNPGQQRCPRPLAAPVDGGLALHAGGKVGPVSPGLAPFPDADFLSLR